jgi:TRAP-type transport system small permease protein
MQHFLAVAEMVRRLFEIATFFCLVVMVSSISVQVVGRYVFSFPIADAVEISTFAQVWLVCLGAGLAVRHNALFTVDVFVSSMSDRMRRLRDIGIFVCGSVFLFVLFWGSLSLLKIGTRQVAPTLQFAMWWVYIALPIGFFYFWLELLFRVCLPNDRSRDRQGDAP